MKRYPFTGPLDKEKDIAVDRKAIARLFNQPISLGDSGTAKLRKGSQTGEILEEFDVHSQKVSASGSELVLFPENTLPYETEIFLTMDDGFVVAKTSGEKCNFLNETSEITHSFTTRKEPEIVVIEENPIEENPIGKSLDGGIIISKSGGRYLIVSPKKAELELFWEEREKAIAHTEEVTGTSGWFVPSLNLLINEDLNVRDVWFKSEDDNIFWTNDDGRGIDMSDLIPLSINKNTSNKVRTFKFIGV
jgi:hypothetical protein